MIELAMGWSPPVWLFGGFAEDAVLNGQVTRPHVDIDLLAFRDDLPVLMTRAAGIGFERFTVRWHNLDGQPLAAGSVAGGIDLEFCIADRTDEDLAYFGFPSSAGAIRMWFPEDAFGSTLLAAIPVRTVSPLILFQTREVLAGLFGGQRPKDVLAQRALKDKFFPDLGPDQLAPRIEPA